LGDVARAIECYEQALTIDRQLGERSAEATDSWNLGLLYERQGDLQRAIAFIQVYVDFAYAVNHPDADSDAQWLAALRRRLGEADVQE
jgi:tetratricopeptide (TPR) repeat protein